MTLSAVPTISDSITAAELAGHLKCARETVYRMARRKVNPIPHIRVGREYRFYLQDVKNHLSAKPTAWKQSTRSLGRKRAA